MQRWTSAKGRLTVSRYISRCLRSSSSSATTSSGSSSLSLSDGTSFSVFGRPLAWAGELRVAGGSASSFARFAAGGDVGGEGGIFRVRSRRQCPCLGGLKRESRAQLRVMLSTRFRRPRTFCCSDLTWSLAHSEVSHERRRRMQTHATSDCQEWNVAGCLRPPLMKLERVATTTLRLHHSSPIHPSTMADNDEAWVTNSNEALNLQLGKL